MNSSFAFSRLQLGLSLIGLGRYREAMHEVEGFEFATGEPNEEEAGYSSQPSRY